MKDLHLCLGAVSGEAYIAKVKKDGTMTDNRQRIPRDEVLKFIHHWAEAESDRLSSNVISITAGGLEVLQIIVKNKDFPVDLFECKYED